MAEGEQKADDAETEGEGAAPEKKKKGLLGPLMIGLALALLLGGGSAFAVMSGLIPLGKEKAAEHADGDAHGKDKKAAEKEKKKDEKPPVFLAFDPLTVTLTRGGAPKQLRLEFSLETTAKEEKTLEEMKPRVLDALNTLLRALDERELTEPASLDRLRAQMLRRVQIATDPDAVKNLLITEFVVF